MRRLSACGVTLVVAVGLPGPVEAANPEDPGPFQVSKSERTESIAGESVTFDLYLPQGLAGPAPAVVVGHGFQRSREKMAGWGEALAQRGYVAAALDFPGLVPDYQLNGQLLVGLLDWLAAQGSEAQSLLAGLVDPGRRAVVGHSAGGLAAYVAASKDPSIQVVVGLDPVDTNDTGKQAAAAIKAATMIVRAEPGTCNSQGNAEQIYQAFGGPKVTLRVTGGSHCDPESPSDALCGMFCGGDADPARHAIFRRYALAMLDYVLLCDDQMAPWIAGPSAQGDAAIEDLRFAALPPAQATCDSGPAADGGPADDAAAASDSGTAPDAAKATDAATNDAATVAADAGAAADAAGDDSSGDGGGCDCRVGAPRAVSLWLLAVVLVALVRRARRG